mgnify:CR=1 FL=1
MNTSKTDHGITANLKEVVLDEGVLLFEVHAEIDDSEDDHQGNRHRFHLLLIQESHLIWKKTTINGQKLDEYMSGNYTPYSAEDYSIQIPT